MLLKLKCNYCTVLLYSWDILFVIAVVINFAVSIDVVVSPELKKNAYFTVWIRKTNEMSLFVFFISLLIVAQHVSGNHVPIIRS